MFLFLNPCFYVAFTYDVNSSFKFQPWTWRSSDRTWSSLLPLKQLQLGILSFRKRPKWWPFSFTWKLKSWRFRKRMGHEKRWSLRCFTQCVWGKMAIHPIAVIASSAYHVIKGGWPRLSRMELLALWQVLVSWQLVVVGSGGIELVIWWDAMQRLFPCAA